MSDEAAPSQTTAQSSSKALSPWLSVAIILLLCFIANARSLGCYFFADDFLCLEYLYKIFHGDFPLLLHRLISPWQDKSVSLLYRPVCDILFSADYALYQANAFGYHLTNLGLHCAASVLLFFCVKRICWNFQAQTAQMIALISAAIFSAYPVHIEAIAWLVCRADLATAALVLASFLVAVKNFQSEKPASLLSPLLFLFALLSKEASACLPAIIFLYLLLLSVEKTTWKTALRLTMPFIVVSVVYLMIRQIILGTALGGYKGSLGDALTWHSHEQLLNWQLISLLGTAANLAIFSAQSPSMVALRVIYFLLAIVLAVRAFISPWDKPAAKTIIFFAASTLCALVPAAQVLGISGVLTNSRIYYLASAFYIPLLVSAIVPTEKADKNSLRILLTLSLVSCWLLAIIFTFVSNKSYSSWLDGSMVLRNLQSATHEKLLRLAPGKKMVVLFQYANFRGAHLLYEFNELKTLVGPNFFADDRSEKLLALDEFPDFHTGSTTRLRRMLNDSTYDVEFFNFEKQTLETVTASTDDNEEPSAACTIVETHCPDSRDRAYWVTLPRPAHIDDSSQIELTINWKIKGTKRLSSFLFSNAGKIPEENSLAGSVGDYEKGISTYHIHSFELRRMVAESPTTSLYAQLPKEAELLSANLIHGRMTALLTPDLQTARELSSGNYCPVKGEATLNLDVSQVPQATGMVLELAKAGYLFQMSKTCARCPQAEPYERLDKTFKFNSTKAVYQIPVTELKTGNRYAYRLIAVDAAGKYSGYYSDTVCIDLR